MSAVTRVLDLLLSSGATALLEHITLAWGQVRRVAIVPVLRFMVVMCLTMSLMMLSEKLFTGAVSLAVRLLRRSPKTTYKWEAMAGGSDVELGSLAYPMVLVQVPLYNETQVYKVAIEAACNLEWPSDRLVIQVLDDSTDPVVKELVQKECEKWLLKGVNINLETRDNRNGYKAGALKDGMKCNYVQDCDYAAIFDADHQPLSNFLMESIPFLVHNTNVALVQARWKFVNANDSLMTRIQEMSMDYHFKVEQEAGSSTCSFFGFNGTAGVWRILAINEAGGWKERTTVEDMDLAVRASLKGWKFVYVGDIKVNSELPSSFKAYRYQQHRWACGPTNLFRKITMEVLVTKEVSIWKKLYVLYSFFFARKVISHVVTFIFYTIVIPVSIFIPEVEIPMWGVVYIPIAISLLCSVGTPSSIHLIVLWVLFEQAMSFHRCKAMYIGLLEAKRAKEWVVTEKLGDKLNNLNKVKNVERNFWERLYLVEVALGFFLFSCASYDYAFRIKGYYLYMFPQSIAFLVIGFGYVGT